MVWGLTASIVSTNRFVMVAFTTRASVGKAAMPLKNFLDLEPQPIGATSS